MSMPTGYKPSPLGFGSSPRASPFRRPESPASPSPLRQSTASTASTSETPATNGSRFAASGVADSPPTMRGWTPGGGQTTTTHKDGQPWSPSRTATPNSPTPSRAAPAAILQGNALSHLQPSQVRLLREGFQILDRDSDGVVNREDVADMLNQMGLSSNPSDVAQFFPPSAPQTMTLAVFLNSLATMLAALSPSSELISAFSAFDDDDSGQVDLAELRDALLNTVPDLGERALTAKEFDLIKEGFTGRRALSKNSITSGGFGKRGDVFRYHDFVNSLSGGPGDTGAQGVSGEDDSAAES